MNPTSLPAQDTAEPAVDDVSNIINAAGELATSDFTKDWWQSKTIQAALVAMLPAVAHIAGVDYSLITPYAGDIVTIMAGVAAILGRRAAVTVIR